MSDHSLVPAAGWLEGRERGTGPGVRYLILVTLLAAALRLIHLGRQSLWIDEIMTWQSVRPGLDLGFWQQLADAIQGPLYLAAVWPLVRIADTEVMLRLPAAIAGIVAVPLLGMMVGRLWDARAARLAALLLAINPFHIWYSQEARGYAFAMLAAVSALLVFVIMAQDGVNRRRAGMLAGLIAAGILSNMSTLFLWVALAICLVLAVRPRGWRAWGLWAAAGIGGLLAVSPWLLRAAGIWAVDRVVPGSGVGDALRGDTTFSPFALPYTVWTFFYGYSLGPSLRELHQPDRLAIVRESLPLLAVGGVAAAIPTLFGLRRLRGNRWCLLLLIVIPLAVVTWLAVRNVKPYNPRYVAVTLPWVLTLAALGLSYLPRRVGLAASVALIGLCGWSVANHHFLDHYAKADLREAAHWVAAQEPAGEPILIPAGLRGFAYYYRGTGQLIDTDRTRLLTDAAAANLVATRLAGVDRCWLVLTRSWVGDPDDRLPAALAASGRLMLARKLPGVRVFYWRRSGAEGGRR